MTLPLHVSLPLAEVTRRLEVTAPLELPHSWSMREPTSPWKRYCGRCGALMDGPRAGKKCFIRRNGG